MSRIRREQEQQMLAVGTAVGSAVASYVADKAKDYVVGKAKEYVSSAYGRYKKYAEHKPKLRGVKGKNKILTRGIGRMPRKPFSIKRVNKATGAVSYRRPGRPGGQPYKSRRSYRKKPKVSKQIKDIQRALKADQARHIYKSVFKDVVTSANFKVNHVARNLTGITTLETMMANLRYYDPATPGTLVTASGGTGTFARKIHFKNVHCKIDIRASYMVPARIKVYIVTPKGDTNIAPLTYYNNGIDDQVINTADETTPLLYLTDINVFKEQWNVKLLKDVELPYGKSTSVSWNTGPFDYDPSLTDSHSLEYQPKYKSASWIIRIESPPGHDTSTGGQLDFVQSSVDVFTYTKAEILYDAGIGLDDVYLSNNLTGAFSASGVTSQMPMGDNSAWNAA